MIDIIGKKIPREEVLLRGRIELAVNNGEIGTALDGLADLCLPSSEARCILAHMLELRAEAYKGRIEALGKIPPVLRKRVERRIQNLLTLAEGIESDPH